MKSYYIYLLRHGLTDGNKQMKYIGHTDEPLSKEGRAQIEKMKEDYDYPHTDIVFSSPLLRCKETAKLIYPNAAPIEIDGLIEYNFGEFEGKTAEELKDHPVFPDWLAGKKGVAAPFGESNEAFSKRIAESFVKIVDGLIKTGTRNCAIVTHGGVLTALLSFFGIPEAPMNEWAVPGGCGYELRITPSLWSQGKKLEVIGQLPYVPGEEDDYVHADDFDADFNVEDYLYD